MQAIKRNIKISPSKIMQKITEHSILLLLFCSAVWAATPSMFKVGSQFTGASEMAFLRLFIGGLFLLPICIVFKQKIFTLKNIPHFALLGFSNNALCYYLIAKASAMLDTGIVAILSGIFPVFSTILSALFLGDKITKRAFLGILISIMGLIFIYFNVFAGVVKINTISILMVLLANFLYALSAIFIKSKCSHITPLAVTTASLLFGSFYMLPFFVVSFNFSVLLVPKFVFSMLFLGIFGTSIAFFFYFSIVKSKGANFAATHSFLIPIFGTIYGLLFFGEKITIFKIFGMIMILIGMRLLVKVSIRDILRKVGKKIKKSLQFKKHSKIYDCGLLR